MGSALCLANELAELFPNASPPSQRQAATLVASARGTCTKKPRQGDGAKVVMFVDITGLHGLSGIQQAHHPNAQPPALVDGRGMIT